VERNASIHNDAKRRYRKYLFMRRKSVVISGTGIAGSVLAYWLLGRGFEPTIVHVQSAELLGWDPSRLTIYFRTCHRGNKLFLRIGNLSFCLWKQNQSAVEKQVAGRLE